MFNFWTKGRASEVAVEINHVSKEERKALNDFTSIAQALVNLKRIRMDFDGVMVVVRSSTIETRRAWLKDAKIADEIVRVRAEKAADVAEACANLKIDPATMNIKHDEINNPRAVQRAISTHEAIAAEIARIRFEKEQICYEEYDQAFAKLGKINEARAVDLAKKHKREMDEERKRAYTSIEAEVARIRVEKAAKCADDGEVPVSLKYP